MNKTIFVSALASFLIVLVLALPISAQAGAGAWNYVDETNATYTSKSGPYTNITTTGYPPSNMHAYKSTNRTFNGPNNTMKWMCNTSTSTNYNYHTYIAIPYNTGTLDGKYNYTAVNTVGAENFTIPINQELYANQFVYIGWTQGKGGSASCYVTTDNIELLSPGIAREFWVDHMIFWPNLSTTPPNYTFGW